MFSLTIKQQEEQIIYDFQMKLYEYLVNKFPLVFKDDNIMVKMLFGKRYGNPPKNFIK